MSMLSRRISSTSTTFGRKPKLFLMQGPIHLRVCLWQAAVVEALAVLAEPLAEAWDLAQTLVINQLQKANSKTLRGNANDPSLDRIVPRGKLRSNDP